MLKILLTRLKFRYFTILGAENLRDGLALAQVLVELNLSRNSLGDKGLFNLIQGIREAQFLMTLDLSHNELTEDCAEALEKIILENNKLNELDLSWNYLNTGPGILTFKITLFILMFSMISSM